MSPSPAATRKVGTFRLEIDPARRQVVVADVGTRSSGLHVPATVVQDGRPATNPPETFQIVTLGVRLPGEGTCPATDNCFDVRVDSFLSRNARQVTVRIDGVAPVRALSNADTPPAEWGLASPFGVVIFGDVAAGGSSSVEEMRFAIPDLSPYVVYMSLFEADPVGLSPGVVGAAWEVDAPVQSAGCGAQVQPALATRGSQALLAWNQSCGGTTNIQIQLVDASGAGIAGSRTALAAARPGGDLSVASSPNGYLLVWSDFRSSPSQIYAARISPAGVVLDPDGVPVAPAGAGRQIDPSVAYTGQSYVIAWTDHRNGDTNPDIYTAVVDATGLLSPPSGVPFAATAAPETNAWADGHATGAAIAWSDGTDGRISRVALDGSRIDPAAIRLPGVDAAPLGGLRCGVAVCVALWRENNALWTRAFNIGTGLAGIDAAVFATPVGTFGRGVAGIDFDPTSDRFVLFWSDEAAVPNAWTMRAYRIRASGPAAGQGVDTGAITLFGRPRADSMATPAAIVIAGNHLLVWPDIRSRAGFDLFRALVSPALVAGPQTLVVDGENEQGAPAVAFDGASYFVVWSDTRDGPVNLYGRRFDATGAALGPSVLIGTDIAGQAVLAAGTDGWLVAWHPIRPARAVLPMQSRRITAAGALMPVVPIGILQGSGAIDIAFSGTTYLVTSGSRAQVVAADGSMVGQPFEVVPGAVVEGAAFDGTSFILGSSAGGSVASIASLTTVSPLGGVGPSVAFAGPLAYPPLVADVASNGSVVVALYYENGPPDGTPDPELWARAMPVGGVFGPPFRVSATPRRSIGRFSSVQLASDGQRFFAAWSGDDGVYGTWLDGSGNVTHPDGFLLGSEGNSFHGLSLASAEPGYVVMASTHFLRSAPEAAPRVLIRRIGGP